MAYIPQIKIGNTTYNVKDSEAREQIIDSKRDLRSTVSDLDELMDLPYYSFDGYINQSWGGPYVIGNLPLKKYDYIECTVTFDYAPTESTYIYLRNGSTNITYYQCQDYASRSFIYKAASDIPNFNFAWNTSNYVGHVKINVRFISVQSKVDDSENFVNLERETEYGFLPLERLGQFVVGAYDYPDYNYNSTYQVSSKEVIKIPYDMFIRVADGFQITALRIENGQVAGTTGWQGYSTFLPKDSNFVLKIQRANADTTEHADVATFLKAIRLYDDNAYHWHSIKGYADKYAKGYSIDFATGEIQTAGGYFELFQFKNPKFKRIKVHASIYGRSDAEIAFYSTEEISTAGYISSASECPGSWDQDHHTYAIVPDNCKLVCVSSRDCYNNNDPFVPEIFVEDDSQYKNVELNSRFEGLSIYKDFKYLYHFGVNDPTAAEIPPESLFDIDAAHRLGFKAFELNVHKTATPGKYVCFHGVNGKIGSELVARNGTDISDLVISEVTYQTFLEDYVYNTSNPQYRTHVTFLDEALNLCKKYGMIPWLGWADYGAVDYYNKYVGNRYILGIYDTWYIRKGHFKGTYSLYQTLTTEQLKEAIRKSGEPLLYCITTEQLLLTDSELRQLAETCHENGSLIGFAGTYQTAAQNMKLIDLGYDFCASGWEVEDFTNGNLLSLRSNGTFTGFVHTGTVSNEVLSLADQDTLEVELTGETPYIAKASLKIRFSGTLVFNMGDHITNMSITSDGSRDTVITSAFFRGQPVFSAEASGSVSVYSCVFDASVC